MKWQNNLSKGCLHFFSDGAVRIKPPATATAVVVKTLQGQVLNWYSRVMPTMTNNEAEYQALLDALMLALKLCPATAHFHLDSQIVVGQVTGAFAVRDTKLKPLCEKAKALVGKLAAQKVTVAFFFIPREFNLLADALAADALLLHPERERKTVSEIRKEKNLD